MKTFHEIFLTVGPEDTEDDWTNEQKENIEKAVESKNITACQLLEMMDLSPNGWTTTERSMISTKLGLIDLTKLPEK